MLNIAAELRRLESLTVTQAREEFARVTGEPARSNNKTFLVKRIIWARQAAAQNGLSERARARATELARDRDLRVRPPQAIHDAVAAVKAPALRLARADAGKPTPPTTVTSASPHLPPVGSVLVRLYRGRQLTVRVLDRGFEYEGQVFNSLSAVARRITGAQWSGALFFNLRDRSNRQ